MTVAPSASSLLPDQGDFDCDCALIAEGQALPSTPLPYPVCYALELTPWCNNRCVGCSNVFVPRSPALSFRPSHSLSPLTLEQWESVLAMIAPHAGRIKLTGGEPTGYPPFAELLEVIAHYALPTTLFTNGRWVDPECTLRTIRKHSDWVRMLVSLHGADANTHDRFTGVSGSFVQTVQTIRRATRVGVHVTTNTVLTKDNVHQIASIVTLARSLGAIGAIFNRYIRGPFSSAALIPPPALLHKAIQTIGQLNTKGMHVRIGTAMPWCFAEQGGVRNSCLAGLAACAIDPWGNMRPCNHAPIVTGNILTESLTAAWHADAMNSWRSHRSQLCQQCTKRDQCQGGCLVEMAREGSDPLVQGCTSSASTTS